MKPYVRAAAVARADSIWPLQGQGRGGAVREPLMPARGEIGISERGLHPDATSAHRLRADRHVR